MKKALLISLIVIGISALLFFRSIPHGIDRLQNGVFLPLGSKVIVPDFHRTLRVVDLHADTLLWDRDLLSRGDRGHADLIRLQEGHVALQVFSVVTKAPRGLNIDENRSDSDNISLLVVAQRWPRKTWDSLLARALYQAERLNRAVQDSEGRLRAVRNQNDLEIFLRDREKDPRLVGAILALEGSHALEDRLSNLDLLEAAGFRILAPTHLFDSEVAGSQQGERKGGLTEMGRNWVSEMNRRKLIIDLAHASSQTIDEVLNLSERPVMVSHTGLQALCPNNRNLSDEQVRRIAQKGGLIGVGFWEDAVCGRDFKAVAKTLRHLIEIGGLNAAALGSDWDGFVTTVTDASAIGALTETLMAEKFTTEEIRAVMGENSLRFFRSQLP